jgi:hypothetical protein
MHKELVILDNGSAGVVVKDIGGVYPKHSVLAGQTIIRFVDRFETLEEAREAFPEARVSHALLMPQNSFDHLEDYIP